MSGDQLKQILRQHNVNLCDLAQKLGYNSDQALHSVLKASDVKSGLLEQIAKEMGRSVGYFYDEDDTEIAFLRQENKKLRDVIKMLLDSPRP